jgi:lysophospholipase L1-like esterase
MTSCLLRLAVLALLVALSSGQTRAQTVSASASGTATIARATATNVLPFEKEILAFEAADRTNPPPAGGILFVGSSSIRLWKTLAADFPQHPVFNRGFGGSQIIDSVRYAERIVLPYKPRLIVLYAGGNDINAGKTPEQVFADYRAFVEKVHAALPSTRIAYISIAPNPARWAQVDRVRAANKLIEARTRTDARLAFIDVFPKMLGDDGQPLPNIYVADRLHMNAEGYNIWRGIVAPVLERWPKEDSK